jgi:Tfp pilus assembly protein PilO
MKPNQPIVPIKKSRFSWKVSVGILGALNIIFLLISVFLASRMETAGKQIKELRTKQVAQTEASSTVATEELSKYKAQYEKVLEAFPSENEVIGFVSQIDGLKKAGVVSGFSFASDIPLKDKNGILGLPILIEAKGSLEQINAAVEAIEKLPVILSAVKTEITKVEDGSYLMRWGGFLYVDQNYGKSQ